MFATFPINGRPVGSHFGLQTSSVHDRGMSFGEAVTLGLVPGCTRVATLGTNPVAAASDSFWPGSTPYPWIPSARTLEVVSSSASDVAAGAGARTVLVQGLDANYNQISEVVTLNGTTVVALANMYLRLNSALLTGAGSSMTNVGTITFRDTGAGATRGIIPVDPDGQGIGFLSQSAYTVPAGFTLMIHSAVLSINRSSGTSNNNVSARNWIFNPVTGALLRPFQISASSTVPYRHEVPGYPIFSVAQKVDVDLVITSASSGFNVTGGLLGTLMSNSTVITT